jgi:DNA-binding MarR family transcriptional regulator
MTSGSPPTTATPGSPGTPSPLGPSADPREGDGLEDVAAPGPRAHDEELASALRIAVMRLSRRLRSAQADESLTLSQISALSSLDRHGPCSPTALAEIERVQPPSMTRVLAGLEERGLARRAPHETDRRQAVIALSEAGKALLEETRRQRHAWLTRCLDELSEADRATLRAALPVLERLDEAR